jgi:capsular polysaccharide transport system permease protein
VAEFERLSLEHEFATRSLAAAAAGLESARSEARRQLLYLERVVEPHLSDHATRPYRIRNIVVTFAGSLVIFLIAWLVASGVREHAHSAE